MSTDDRREELDEKLGAIQNADWLNDDTDDSGAALFNLAGALASHILNINDLSDADVDELIGLCDKLAATHDMDLEVKPQT